MGKRKMYFGILALAAGMLMMVCYGIWAQQGSLLERLEFRETVQGLSMKPYFNAGGGTHYLFLPGYITVEDVKIEIPFGAKAEVEGKPAATLAGLPEKEDLTLTVSTAFRKESCTIQIWRCENLPTLSIELEDGALEIIHADKNNEKDMVVTMFDETGTCILRQPGKMTGRGNGTWNGQPKLPYNLNFSTAVSVGPFEEANQLCLLAEYSDESKMRNSLAYFGGQQLGIDYASPYMYTNLYINGEYMGLYGIVTKTEYEKHIMEDGIQAVFELSAPGKKREFVSELLVKRFRVHYGDLDTVRERVNEVESAMLIQDWERCAELIDMASFAKKYAMEEFFCNFDLSYGSQYYYLDQNGVIHCMLPWDYDWSMGSTVIYYNNTQTHEILAYRTPDCWYAHLLNCGLFLQEMEHVLSRDYTADLFTSLQNHLEQTTEMIADSRECDFLRWQSAQPFNQFRIQSGIVDFHDYQKVFLEFFPKRHAFLLDYAANRENYCTVEFLGAQYGNFCIPRGERLEDYIIGANILEGYMENNPFLGWYTDDGLTPEDVDTVQENMIFRGKFVDMKPILGS